MDEPTRRAWNRPELIVIVRSGPEEAVLTTCKVFTTNIGNADGDGGCTALPATDCSTPCEDIAAS